MMISRSMDPSYRRGSSAIVATIPDRHPGKLFGGGVSARSRLTTASALPAPGPPPALKNPELLRDVLLGLALRDETLSGAEAAEVAERALSLASGERALDPPAALEAAKEAHLQAQ